MEGKALANRQALRTQGNVKSDVSFLQYRIIAKRSVDSILNERHLLSTLNYKFLVNMVYAFQDRTTLYLLMDIEEGGDLRYHLAKKHKFSELETRCIVATIILSLE